MSGFGLGNSYAEESYFDEEHEVLDTNDENIEETKSNIPESEDMTLTKEGIKDLSSLMDETILDENEEKNAETVQEPYVTENTPDVSDGVNEDTNDQNLETENHAASNVERISDSDIEVVDKEIDISSSGSLKNVKYKTGDVAKMCGTSEQQIRNYTSFFEEFLTVETVNTHRFYSYDDVEKLKLIFNLRNEQKLTMGQIKDFLNSGTPELSEDIVNEKGVTYALMLKSMEDVFSKYTKDVTERIQEIKQSSTLLLQKNIADHQRLIEKNNEMLEKSSEAIEKLQSEIETKDDIIKQLMETNQKYEKLVEDSMKQNEVLSEKLEEVGNKKKKRWFF